MKVLIIGGTRFVGLKTAKIFSNLGHQVTTLSRSNLQLDKVKHLICDRKNDIQLKEAIIKESPDFILDMVCFDRGDSLGMIDLFNRGFFEHVKHYCVISTFFLYNYFDNYGCNFNGDIESIKDGYTKRKAELEREFYNSKIFEIMSIVRFPFIFSHDDYTGRFQNFCKLVISSNPVDFDNQYKMSMIEANEAANSLVELSLKKPMGFIDIANYGCLSQREMAYTMSRLFKNDKLIEPTQLKLNPYNLSKNLCLITNKIPDRHSLKSMLDSEFLHWQKN
jgi:nucleoside-diphosphate-sugar epimerase